MIFLDLKGRKKTLRNARKYAIDWNKKTRSKFQDATKKFLYPFWKGDYVFEELRVVGSLMTLDIYNHSKKIAVETDGRGHNEFIKHFHRTRSGFLGQVKRDLQKEDFLEKNGIVLVRIQDEKELTYDFFVSLGIIL